MNTPYQDGMNQPTWTVRIGNQWSKERVELTNVHPSEHMPTFLVGRDAAGKLYTFRPEAVLSVPKQPTQGKP
jgi:hypothetical protein